MVAEDESRAYRTAAQAMPSVPLPVSIFLGDLPGGQVELGFSVRGDAGDPGGFVAGLGQDFFRVGGGVDGADDFHGGDVDDGELVLSGDGDEDELAVVGGGGAVGDARERDPVGDLVGAGVNGGEAGLGLVGGEDPAVVGGDGDALGLLEMGMMVRSLRLGMSRTETVPGPTLAV
jgi:hypothetical protein